MSPLPDHIRAVEHHPDTPDPSRLTPRYHSRTRGTLILLCVPTSITVTDDPAQRPQTLLQRHVNCATGTARLDGSAGEQITQDTHTSSTPPFQVHAEHTAAMRHPMPSAGSYWLFLYHGHRLACTLAHWHTGAPLPALLAAGSEDAARHVSTRLPDIRPAPARGHVRGRAAAAGHQRPVRLSKQYAPSGGVKAATRCPTSTIPAHCGAAPQTTPHKVDVVAFQPAT